MADAVSAFGVSAKAKLSAKGITGAPEDQLRNPLEALIQDVAQVAGLKPGTVVAVGETTLSGMGTRPDFAITVGDALTGFIEVKAPGKGADPRAFSDKHDKTQWSKLKSLPNLIYTDGNAFSLWQDGQIVGRVHQLDGDIATAGAKLSPPASLERLFSDFFGWKPIAPTSAMQLAQVSARLCRLLRDEVTEQLAVKSEALTNLAEDWRRILFPHSTPREFADGYAQAVTFGLLVARAQKIPINEGLESVAKALGQATTVIGSAFRVLTDDVDSHEALKTSLDTLTRVLSVVDWAKVSKGSPDAWLYFYEYFLAEYDNDLRKKTGSYYTPPQVVTSMVRLVDELLRDPDRFAVAEGLASPEVTLADPAAGTGTYLLGVLRRIAETTAIDQGAGAVPGMVLSALKRTIGFELQFGPFAVAQLRIMAEVTQLANLTTAQLKNIKLRLHVTDTLGNPFEAEEHIPNILRPLAASRIEANTIKRSEPIMIVLGNPPYKEKAKGRGGWVEGKTIKGRAKAGTIEAMPAPFLRWIAPPSWGVSVHTKHLRNLYIYFWRWATWKVFGDAETQTGTARKGVVSFITVAGFLNGQAFEKMRDDLRRSCEEIWVIDCSPEGHQPEVATRIFQDVQQPVCIVMASRTGRVAETMADEAGATPAPRPDEIPARVRYRSLPKGRREEKFDALAVLTLDDAGWVECRTDWRAPFLPAATGEWATFPPLEKLFIYNGSGVMPGRQWVIAPDRQSLTKRWEKLLAEPDLQQKEILFHPHGSASQGDRHISKVVSETLTGHEKRTIAVSKDTGAIVTPIRYAFRSFDRQWIIPDNRLLNRPNPTLWNGHSKSQVYLTALNSTAPAKGPGLTFTTSIPDIDHYNGRGGRVFPLWSDPAGKQPNVQAGLLAKLAETYETAITAEDVMAYIAAVAAHPAYAKRFRKDLVQPGIRVPLTDNAALFKEAATLGREVIWLQVFGEHFIDQTAGRPAGAPRMASGEGPTIPAEGAIPSDDDQMPDTITYDPSLKRLQIGTGYIDNVPPEVWAYEVSGKHVLLHWFSYRKKDRSKPIIGDKRPPSPLGDIQPGWLPEYTSELINVLHILGRLIPLEEKQADLLQRICDGKLIEAAALPDGGIYKAKRKKKAPAAQGVLLAV
jgi:hypothetical protein